MPSAFCKGRIPAISAGWLHRSADVHRMPCLVLADLSSLKLQWLCGRCAQHRATGLPALTVLPSSIHTGQAYVDCCSMLARA